MKVRVCPACGKRNDENTWSCADCGTTLGVNTLIDAEDLLASPTAMAGKGVLSGVSTYFQEDLTALFKRAIQSNESLVKGCNICKPSILPPFKFGYLILTSHQLICVYFSADTEVHLLRMLPKRHFLVHEKIGHTLIAGRPQDNGLLLVDRPSYELTATEKSSREVVSFPLEKLYATELADDLFLTARFTAGDGTLNTYPITFYFNDEAFKIQELLAARLRK